MTFTLVWPKALIRRLTALYLQARSEALADDFTQAVAQIEYLLQNAPLNQGESRSANERILVVRPLSATYRIDELNKRVYIRAIGYSNRIR